MDYLMAHNLLKDLREQSKLTQQALSEKAGISTLAVLRAEQYIPPVPPQDMVQVLSKLTSTPVELINRFYHSERELLHTDFFDRFVDYPILFQRAVGHAVDHFEYPDKHPVKLFREFIMEDAGLPTSQIKFCMYTGIHPATLSSIEKGSLVWESCLALHRVLRRFGVTETQMETLGLASDNYYLKA